MADEKELPRRQTQSREPCCPVCAASLRMAEYILDPSTNKTVRLYHRQCGQRVWEE
jgi:C4-type Zn-finger protein